MGGDGTGLLFYLPRLFPPCVCVAFSLPFCPHSLAAYNTLSPFTFIHFIVFFATDSTAHPSQLLINNGLMVTSFTPMQEIFVM